MLLLLYTLIPLCPPAFVFSKDHVTAIFSSSQRFDQSFLPVLSVSAPCPSSLVSHRDLYSNRILVLSLVNTSNLHNPPVTEKAMLNLPPHHQSPPYQPAFLCCQWASTSRTKLGWGLPSACLIIYVFGPLAEMIVVSTIDLLLLSCRRNF